VRYAPRRQLLAPFITHVLTDLVELTVAKTLGVLAFLIPSVPLKVKEFAYFGFAITLVSASIAHFAVGDAGRPPLYAFYIVDPLIFLAEARLTEPALVWREHDGIHEAA
jgi:DoxX-like family